MLQKCCYYKGWSPNEDQFGLVIAIVESSYQQPYQLPQKYMFPVQQPLANLHVNLDNHASLYPYPLYPFPQFRIDVPSIWRRCQCSGRPREMGRTQSPNSSTLIPLVHQQAHWKTLQYYSLSQYIVLYCLKPLTNHSCSSVVHGFLLLFNEYIYFFF